MMAIRMSTDVISKGSRKSRNSKCPIPWADPYSDPTRNFRADVRMDKSPRDGDRSDDQAGHAEDQRDLAAARVLFFAGIQQHDDEDEEHHDGAGIDDDLDGREKFRAEEKVVRQALP